MGVSGFLFSNGVSGAERLDQPDKTVFCRWKVNLITSVTTMLV